MIAGAHMGARERLASEACEFLGSFFREGKRVACDRPAAKRGKRFGEVFLDMIVAAGKTEKVASHRMCAPTQARGGYAAVAGRR